MDGAKGGCEEAIHQANEDEAGASGSRKPSPVFLILTSPEPSKGSAGVWEVAEDAKSVGTTGTTEVTATRIYLQGHFIGATKPPSSVIQQETAVETI